MCVYSAKGVPQIEVTFHIDGDGILSVSALDRHTGQQNEILIVNEKTRLSSQEVESILLHAEMMRCEDEQEEDILIARIQLQTYMNVLLKTIRQSSIQQQPSHDRDTTSLLQCIESIQEWMNVSNKDETRSKQSYQAKQQELEHLAQPLLLQPVGGKAIQMQHIMESLQQTMLKAAT